MKKKLIFAALTVLSLVSCNKSAEIQTDPQKESEIPAGYVKVNYTASNEVSKTTIGPAEEGVRPVLWQKGDAVKFYYGEGEGEYTVAQSTTEGSTAVFEILVPQTATDIYAVYPATAGLSLKNGIVSVGVNKVQDGKFATANVSVAKTSVSADAFTFCNVCSLVRIEKGNDAIRTINMTAEGQELAGTLPVSFNQEGAVELGTATDCVDSIQLDSEEGSEFYVAVIPGVSINDGMKFSFRDVTSTEISNCTLKKDFTLERSHLLDVGKLDAESAYDYYVTVSGAGTKDGSSWENAFGFEEFVAFANADHEFTDKKVPAPSVNFYIAAGTYNVTETILPANWKKDGVKLPVKIFGGFPANPVTGSQPSAGASTIFKGGSNKMFQLGNDGQYYVSNITFQDHSSEANANCPLYFGGKDPKSEFIVVNCKFINNVNTKMAGAVVVNCSGSSVIEKCTFIDNKSSRGGAIRICKNGVGCRISGCTFERNSSTGAGGAISQDEATTISTVVSDCTFIGNTAKSMGGAAYASHGTITFEECTFSNNNATDGGGAIECSNNGSSNTNYQCSAKLNIDTCSFTENYSVAYGGAIGSRTSGNVTITRTSFEKNYTTSTADGPNGCGGALLIRSGLCDNRATIKVQNCDFTGNYTYEYNANNRARGGAIAIVTSAGVGSKVDVYVDKCNFIGNKTTQGGAILAHDANVAKLYVNDCIFEKNTSSYRPGTVLAIWNMNELCLNNCSFHNNWNPNKNGGATLAWIYVETTSNFVVSNTSIVGQGQWSDGDTVDHGEVYESFIRSTQAAGQKFYFINNIIANTRYNSMFNTSKANALADVYMYGNKMSKYYNDNTYPYAVKDQDAENALDYFGTSEYFGGLQWASSAVPSYETSYWKWNGTLAKGSATDKFMTRSDMKLKVQTANADFYSWLCTTGVDGLDKDQRGHDRGDNIWPGSYEN